MPVGPKRKQSNKKKGKGAGKGKSRRKRKAPEKDYDNSFEVEEGEEMDYSRYDQESTQDFQYALPADFEDEEIDEDDAFSAEDFKRYGNVGALKTNKSKQAETESDAVADFFDDGEEGETGGEQGASGEGGAADIALSDLWGAESESDGSSGKRKKHKKKQLVQEDVALDQDFEDDEEDDELQDEGDDAEGDSSAAEEAEGEEADDADVLLLSDGDEEEDDADGSKAKRLAALVRGLSNKPEPKRRKGKEPKAKPDEPAEFFGEREPESEFGVVQRGGKLSMQDLMSSLKGDDEVAVGLAGLARDLDQLTSDKATKTLLVPLGDVDSERLQRKSGYITTKKEVSTWAPMVRVNRQAQTLSFPLHEPKARAQETTTASLAGKFQASNDLEKDLSSIISTFGYSERNLQQKEQDQLENRQLSEFELEERSNELAKMKNLLFYHEIKAKRIKKIKSKSYRRLKRKREEKNKLSMEELRELDPEAAEAEQEKMEMKRLTERMTLAHKNTSKWAKRQLRLLNKPDANAQRDDTRKALHEQLIRGQKLAEKIDAVGVEHGSDSESDEYGDPEEEMKQLSADLQADHPDAGNQKGVFGLKFMQRALQKKKAEALDLTRALRAEDGEGSSGDDDDAVNVKKKRRRTVEPATEAELRAVMAVGTGLQTKRRTAGVKTRVKGPVSITISDDEAEEEGGDTTESDGDSGDMKTAPKQVSKDALFQVESFSDDDEGFVVQQKNNNNGKKNKHTHKHTKKSKNKNTTPTPTDNNTNTTTTTNNNSKNSENKPTQKNARKRRRLARARARKAKAATRTDKVGGGRQGRVQKFEKKKAAADEDEDEDEDDDEDEDEDDDGEEGENPWLAQGGGVAASGVGGGGSSSRKGRAEGGKGGQAGRAGSRAAGSSGNAGKSKADKTRGKRVDKQGPLLDPEANILLSAAGGEGEGKFDLLGGGDATQARLVRQAFAQDDELAEMFEAEKEAISTEGLPKFEDVSLPGWGAWGGCDLKPKTRMSKAKLRVKAKIEARAEAKRKARKDHGLSHVIINQQIDKKALKYMVKNLPHGFTSREEFDRAQRTPLGPDWNTINTFNKITMPEVITKPGTTIQPMSMADKRKMAGKLKQKEQHAKLSRKKAAANRRKKQRE